LWEGVKVETRWLFRYGKRVSLFLASGQPRAVRGMPQILNVRPEDDANFAFLIEDEW
jgi:hypothetical protein